MDFMAPGCLTSSRNFKEKLATPMLKGHKANATNAQKAKVHSQWRWLGAGALLPWAVSMHSKAVDGMGYECRSAAGP